MTDYSRGKIYKLVSKDTDEIYIGSTCKTLKRRLAGHIAHYKQFLIGKMDFITSYHLVNYENVQIVLIENFPCQTNAELYRREGYYVRNTVCVNEEIPGRTAKEYYHDNKVRLNARHIKYNAKNKARISARSNTKFLCDCGGKYTRINKTHHVRSLKHQAFIGKQE